MELTESYQLIAETRYTVQGTNSLRLYGKYNSQDSSTNKSNITLQLRTIALTGYYSSYDNSSVLTCDSVNRGTVYYDIGTVDTSSEKEIGTWTFEIEHNPDGTRTGISASATADVYAQVIPTVSGTFDLPTIPRYATATTNVSNIKETSVKVDWSTDVAVDAIRYRLNSGDWIIVEQDVNKMSGAYMIQNLESGTSYTIDFDYKRKDSQQWSFDAGYSSSETITTLDYTAYIKVNNIWKKAIPYIKVNNAWKKAIPYINVNGSWKEGMN